MATGDEGRTRVGHWIKGTGRSLCDGFLLFRDYAQSFFLLFWSTGVKEAEMCGDR